MLYIQERLNFITSRIDAIIDLNLWILQII